MLISHDLGTSGDKATLVDETGKIVDAVTAHYPADWGTDGKAEQSPDDWWSALCEATRKLLQRSRVEAHDVEAVSFSGQMMGVVPLDAHGDVVRPSIIWADTRSTRQCEELVKRVGMERAYRITGHRLNPTYSLTKLMWLRDNEPDSFARTATFVLAKDYVAYRLTGVLNTDPSDASSTNAFDQSTGAWSDELIEAANLARTLFPAIVPSTEVIGTVTSEAARETGLAAGTPVVKGGGDGPMAALGAGIVDRDSGAYCYLGSSSWVSVASDTPLLDPQMRSMTFNHVIPGRFVPTATMQAGGASLSWIVDVLSGTGAGGGYDALLDEADRAQAASSGLYFLPYLLGERSPYWNPDARGVFAGLHIDHGRGALVRAVLEGVAFNLYTCLRAFSENGVRIHRIDAIGGAAKTDLLLQIMADMWGVQVRTRNLVEEANAIGAAVVAGVGVGVFDDFSVAKSLSQSVAQYAPHPEQHEAYMREYPTFVDAYRRLEPWFAAN